MMAEQKGSFLKRVNSESVVQLVINSLTDAMLHRELRPGDKLPTETELAESLGVGRNTIREAIKILVYLGVVEIRRAEGTFVCEGFSESMIDPMIYGIILDTADSYEHLMELREMMEVGVMQMAMDKYTPEEIATLKEVLERMGKEIEKGPANVDNVFEVDNEFHSTISAMGENPLVDKINKVVKVLTHSIRYSTVKILLEENRGDELFDAHQQLFAILKNRDKEEMNKVVRKTYFSKVGIETIGQ